MREHGGALDYDLMTMTTYTLDDVGGRLQMRSLAHFLRYLPPDSQTMRALSPEDGERVLWMGGSVNAQLLAMLVNELRGMQWLYTRVNSKGSVRRPSALETPWTRGDEGVVRYGHGAIPIAEFDDWFDRKE